MPASQALSGSIAKMERLSTVKLRHQERSIRPSTSSAVFARCEGIHWWSTFFGPIGNDVQKALWWSKPRWQLGGKITW